ncbi:MAG: putative short-chain dehydrogenase [Acidimicrobiales bacterium]|nr:putative short-chain dehydrogenase [Acidimicrobiales bacterium]
MTVSTKGLEGIGVLVTGGGSGIGRAAAARLVADGAVVTIAGRSEERLRSAVDELRAELPEARLGHVVADVTDPVAVARAVATAAEAGDGLGAVVASAGGSASFGPIRALDLDGWRRTLEVNLTGTMLTLQAAIPALATSGRGSFVAVSSSAGSSSTRWCGAYGPSKAGIDLLCRQAADELGHRQVRVNSVAPGLVRTDLVSFITAGGPVLDDHLVNTPLGRIGEPEDVAELIRFLVGPESSWITGQRIDIDGGQSLRRGADYTVGFAAMFSEDDVPGL